MSRAVANLLRLAMSDVKDAELLSAGRNPENAGLLTHLAFRRILEAIIATEHGWPVAGRLIALEKIPDANPLKRAVARIARLAPPAKPLALTADGDLPGDFDPAGFREDTAALRKLLHAMAEHFGVDLLGQGPAEHAAARRLAVAPKPEPVTQPPRQAPNPAAKPAPEPKAPAKKPIVAATKPPPIIVPDTRAKPANADAAPAAAGRAPISVASGRANISSTTFWRLMERWGVPDLAALDLIGHGGGLSKKAARPRFKLSPGEMEKMRQLIEIDQTLAILGLDPKAWLNKPVQAAPFAGASPIAYLGQAGPEAIAKTGRYLLRHGLTRSMANTL